jgi:hypothetical protein
VTRYLEKITQYLEKVAKMFVETKNIKISSLKLNLKVGNIYNALLLKSKNTYKNMF